MGSEAIQVREKRRCAAAASATAARSGRHRPRANRLWLEIANRGVVEDLGALNHELVDTVKSVVDSASAAAETNAKLAASMGESRGSADQARKALGENADLVAATLAGAIDKMRGLSRGVFGITNSLEESYGGASSFSPNPLGSETEKHERPSSWGGLFV